MVMATVLLMTGLAAASAAPETRPWRADPLFRQIQARLDTVRAIDNHTHLLAKGQFNPKLDPMMPLGMRSTHAPYADAMRSRFGVTVEGDPAAAAARATAARDAMLNRLGEAAYWKDHLDYTRTDIALVNQDFPDGTDGRRLRWVAHATNLLYPLPAEALVVRSPKHRLGITDIQANTKGRGASHA